MMLKSQLQTTNFSNNFLYELPDEILEMIYRQMFGDVVRQLDKIIVLQMASKRCPSALKFKKNVKAFNMVKYYEICIEHVEKRIQNGYYDDYIRQRGGNYIRQSNLPFKIFWDGCKWYDLTIYNKKEELMQMLQQNNKEVYKSWTKQKMIKALMSF